MEELCKYLNSDKIFFLSGLDRKSVLKELIEKSNLSTEGISKEEYYSALMSRENLVNTAVNNGVALPHARLKNCADFTVVVGISLDGIDWFSFDGSLVHLIFMIIAPEEKENEFFDLLSMITLVVDQIQDVDSLLQDKSSEEIYNTINNVIKNTCLN